MCRIGVKNTKKNWHFTIILECATKIPGIILHFEDPGKKYLSETLYYQQLYGETKAGEVPESGVENLILFFWFYNHI